MWAVLLGNGVLLYGLYALGWTPGTVAFLFWYEAAVIGAATLLKVALSAPGDAPGTRPSVVYERRPRPGSRTSVRSSVPRTQGWSAAPRFVLFYGVVLLGYGALLVACLDGPKPAALLRAALASDGVRLAMAVIAGEHAWRFWREYLNGDAWQRTDPTFHFWKPFGLAVRAYLAFLLGFLILGWLKSPLPVLTVLVLLKTLGEIFEALFDAQAGAWRRVDEAPA